MPCRGFGEFVIISRAGHILQPQLDGPDGNVLPEQARWLVQWASRHRLKWPLIRGDSFKPPHLKGHVEFLIGTRRRYGWLLPGHYGDGWHDTFMIVSRVGRVRRVRRQRRLEQRGSKWTYRDFST
jgi:hypothetical protein